MKKRNIVKVFILVTFLMSMVSTVTFSKESKNYKMQVVRCVVDPQPGDGSIPE